MSTPILKHLLTLFRLYPSQRLIEWEMKSLIFRLEWFLENCIFSETMSRCWEGQTNHKYLYKKKKDPKASNVVNKDTQDFVILHGTDKNAKKVKPKF